MKDKSGKITEHTKEKIKVYKTYLNTYLHVLINNPYIDIINIYEPFAGSGQYDCGTKGSALECIKIVNDINCKNTKINIFLNDKGEKEYKSLQKYIPKQANVKIFNKDAVEFLEENFKKKPKNHDFFFLDPYGYSQIKRDTIEQILEKEGTEVLLFVPLKNLYRFINGDKKDKRLKPVFDFIKDNNIDMDEGLNTDIDVNNFKKKIRNSFKTNNRYAYYYNLKSDENSNQYSLFFITKHILGAEKFLSEVIYKAEKLKTKIELEINNPLSHDKKEKKLLEYLAEERNNCQLYAYLIKEAVLPKHFNEWLEGRKENKVERQYQQGKKSGNHLNYKNYKEKNIYVKFQARG